MDKSQAYVLWFDQLGIEDVPLVGGKNASLGEMYRELVPRGVRIPNGFAVTAQAYRHLIETNKLKEKIRDVLCDLDTHDMQNLAERGQKVRELIRRAAFPQDLQDQIIEAYRHMERSFGEHCDVAVRSSATAEDLPDASFAGQQETFLNVRGPEELLDACRKCFASLFTNRAISYREDKSFDHFNIALSIGVQKMVRSDKAASGVMFSIDTESGFKDAVFVTASWGLGENIVQGAVNPDEYYVFKPTLAQGKRPIITKQLGSKQLTMVYDEGGQKLTKNLPTPQEKQKQFAITDDEVLTLAQWAVIIEEHYSQKAGHFKPMDMEWAKDGNSGELYIVQARPETVMSRKDVTKVQDFVLDEKGQEIIKGKSVGSKIGASKARVIMDVKDINQFQTGEVLVTDMTDPDWEPIMKIASAIVTNRGGRTCHAAIISRELGIPCVVGTLSATELVKTGQDVTVSCAGGDEGVVYEGILRFRIDEVDVSQIPQTKTKVMMNLASPEMAFEQSFIPNQGVGLAREEFVINSWIKIHPLALLHFDKVTDKETQDKINELTSGYADKRDYFIDKLAQGVGKLAAAFYPKDVVLRFSDFKTNEYANLIGGKYFEPKEDNPMIGWRGSSRYYDEKYREGFALECKAVRRIREDMGLVNLKVMIPFCRTVEECRAVQDEMAKHGLNRGENGLEVYVMCEIPANVILADQFLDICDGFSIGSNDLTQLTLGLDRDSELVAHLYDERNDAVKALVSEVIKKCNERKKHLGFCGQAPSDFEDFALFLVENGIESMSLNPDTVIRTTMKIAEKEKELGMSPQQGMKG